MRELKNYKDQEEKLKQINQIERHLSQIKDVDILLENILYSACEIVNADAGSIYEFDEKKHELSIRFSKNSTLEKRLNSGQKLPYNHFSFKPEKTIAGYCALHKELINIEDVHDMHNGFSFDDSTDRATGYYTKSMLVVPLTMTNGRVLGVVQVINVMGKTCFTEEDEFYISHFATTIGQIYEYAYLTKQLIERLVKMAGYRDPKETGEHVERVSSFAVEIYDSYASNKNIPLSERTKFRDNLKLAAKCHDVGKVAIPDGILKKEGALTDQERAIMQGHTCIGAQIFTPIESPLDEMARDVCLHHHDRWDGGSKGYPGKYEDYENFVPGQPIVTNNEEYKGESIPLAARIVALADVYDALRHKRSYKGSWTAEDTAQYILDEKGKQFDPELVDAFMQVRNRIEAINASMNIESSDG